MSLELRSYFFRSGVISYPNLPPDEEMDFQGWLHLFFWSDLFLEAEAEILKKNFVGFLVDLKTPKSLIFRFMVPNLIQSWTSRRYVWKGYLPNLLESTLCHQIFVFWVRDLKFWLLAYFFILLSCAKFQQDWTTLILDIL